MYRIDTALKRRVVRIGLSATLGEMRLAAEFLRPGLGEKVQIVQSNDAGQELKVVVKGYYSRESAAKIPECRSSRVASDIVTSGYAVNRSSSLQIDSALFENP